MSNPLCVDLFCGLGGWSEGFISEGYRVVGFDIERHVYGSHRYPAQLVIQDVLTIHGSQFRNADIIVASPPCQQYSWLAMPWSRSKDPNNSKAAKALRAKWEAEGPDNRLFDACFRIQREASEAAGRYIPLIVENVRGAQEWVGASEYLNGPGAFGRWMECGSTEAGRKKRNRLGRSHWNYGSFHLWGDVPALMPMQRGRKNNGGSWFNIGSPGQAETNRNPVHELAGIKVGHPKNSYRHGHKSTPHLTNQAEHDAMKIGGDWFSNNQSCIRKASHKSNARKAASAKIAKIPLTLSSHIARVYKP